MLENGNGDLRIFKNGINFCSPKLLETKFSIRIVVCSFSFCLKSELPFSLPLGIAAFVPNKETDNRYFLIFQLIWWQIFQMKI